MTTIRLQRSRLELTSKVSRTVRMCCWLGKGSSDEVMIRHIWSGAKGKTRKRGELGLLTLCGILDTEVALHEVDDVDSKIPLTIDRSDLAISKTNSRYKRYMVLPCPTHRYPTRSLPVAQLKRPCTVLE